MNISELTKERVVNGFISAVLGALGFVVASILKEGSEPFARHVVPAIGSANLLWLSLLLIFINLVSWIWVVSLLLGDKNERRMRRYVFDSERGFFRHRRTGQKFCGNCLLEGIESPLSPEWLDNIHWSACGRMNCRMRYQSREDEIPAEPTKLAKLPRKRV